MKCMYYLSPSLVCTQAISDDLHEQSVADWFIHVVSKNEAGLKKDHLHSSNYLETLDFIREGLLFALCGFLLGLVAAGLFKVIEPFGPDIPFLVYFGIVLVCTGFGAWLGGLDGIAHENRKLSLFHDEMEAGKYLVLIYAHKNEEQKISAMMSRLHPESRMVAVDAGFYNPFSRLKVMGA